MKTSDNHFRGFPALWNAAAFYLFLLHLRRRLSDVGIAVLIALTFVPFKFVHPFRVVRLRWLTLWLLALGPCSRSIRSPAISPSASHRRRTLRHRALRRRQ